MSLRDDFIKGNLPVGWYYCSVDNVIKNLYNKGEYFEMINDPEDYCDYYFNKDSLPDYFDILSKVPTLKENNRIKTLLKECRLLTEYARKELDSEAAHYLTDKIDEVLK